MQKRNYVFLPLLAAVVLLAGLPMAAHAQGTVFVTGDNMGIGTSTPTNRLHVQTSTGVAKVLVEEISGTVALREMFELRNNGGPFFIFKDTNTSESYSFAIAANGDFIISHQQTPGVQFRVTPAGNVTIAGTLTQGSSREIKKSFAAVSGSEILSQVADLPLSTWSYKTENATHIGPMAEDFSETFGLGANKTHLAPGDVAGVALAAIQGLNEKVEAKEARIAELEARLARLEQLIR